MDTPRILIVDDEPYNLDYLEQELESYDYQLITASNGREALEKVLETSPDLILLDIMMPEMDGFEVLFRLKADPQTRDIPVVIISAANSLDSVVKGIQLGAEDYLPKPFEPTLLNARISSSLDKKRLRDLEQMYLKSLQKEMEIAREIQTSFLPPEIPVCEQWEVSVFFQSAKEVAGDYYDTFLLEDGSLVCVVGDVCGKGVGAALFMTLFRSLLRAGCTSNTFLSNSATQESNAADRLSEVVNFTNNYVAMVHSEANMFTTLFIGLFNPISGQLTYINAGNEPAVWVQLKNEVNHLLGPTGPIIGIMPEMDFASKQVILEPGDVLIGFSDGVPDALNQDGKSFGKESLERITVDKSIPSTELCKRIEEDILAFIGNADQFDDITLMVIKRKDA
jgi:serine phosphatase RsbU (regulator of sigma subunit)